VTAVHAERRLTAVMAADVVGYTRLMGRDEDGTLARLKAHRKELFEPLVAEYHGRTVKLMGDGALCEFASIVDAVRCAVLSQRGLDERERTVAEADRIRLRIGINLGDVIFDDGDIYGDGVNIAARLQQLAGPGGVLVSGTAYDHLQGKLDLPLDPIGEQRVKNVERPVRAYRVRLGGAPKHSWARPRWRRLALAAAGVVTVLGALGSWWLTSGQPSLPAKPSLAVLPFVNVSGGPADDHYADGVTDDLITDLAKLSGLSVIAHNSVFRYKDQPVAVTDVARDLGVRYAVEGSLRRSGDEMRINVQLVDATTGANLWSERYERSTADVFSIEEEMVGHIATALGVALTPTEQARLARPPTSNLEAYDFFLRAERIARRGHRPSLGEALDLYERATELDPTFANAFAAQAALASYIWRTNYDTVLPGPVARKEAYAKASRALELNPELSLPYTVLSSLQLVGREHEDAIASARRAVVLAPSDAAAHAALGLALTFDGRYAEAAEAIDTSLRLNPTPPTSDAITSGLAFSLNGNHARAIEVLERARAAAPGVEEIRVGLAIAYARAGRLEDAHSAAAEAVRIDPTVCVQLYQVSYAHFRERSELVRILDTLRQAGLPEWPFGFRADELERIDGAEISHLTFGRTWRGQTALGEPALMQFATDGKTAFRTPTHIETGTAFIDHDLLCEQSEAELLGRPRCGPVYRSRERAGEDAFAYTYVNALKVFRFDPLE
jgi:adenylate cyclase